MKVAIVGTNGLPAKYGGFETFVHHYTKTSRFRTSFVVYCSQSPRGYNQVNGITTYNLPLKANGFQSVFYDWVSMIHASKHADLILLLGSSGGLAVPFLRLFGVNIVTNIGGLDWQRSKWSKLTRIVIKFFEKCAVQYSSIVIADNDHVGNVYKELYNVTPEIIAYGGDHVDDKQCEPPELNFSHGEYFLSVSRAQQDNNIHLLIHAFSKLPESNLVIISNWDSSEYGKKLSRKYMGKFSNILLIDAIYDQKELDRYRKNCKAYIHSHTACGTAPSLVEIMSLGKSVIAYDCEANQATTENKAIYFSDEESLIYGVSRFSQRSSIEVANEMRRIAQDKYTWIKIAERYDNIISNFITFEGSFGHDQY